MPGGLIQNFVPGIGPGADLWAGRAFCNMKLAGKPANSKQSF